MSGGNSPTDGVPSSAGGSWAGAACPGAGGSGSGPGASFAGAVSGDDEPQSPGPTDERSQSEKAVDLAESYLGVSSSERRWAGKLGVDPYSTYPPLRERLEDVARVDRAGRIATGFVPSVPGLGYASQMNKLVWSLDAVELARRIAEAAGAGYAISHGAVEPGGSSIAAPVRNREGRVVAAIDISAPDSAFDLSKFESRDVPEVVAAANRISARLGYAMPTSPARGRTAAARARARG